MVSVVYEYYYYYFVVVVVGDDKVNNTGEKYSYRSIRYSPCGCRIYIPEKHYCLASKNDERVVVPQERF